MDNLLLLVKCITLLYRESLLENHSDNSSELVQGILETIKLPELNITLSDEKEQLIGLKATALYLCTSISSGNVDKLDLLQRLRVNCTNNEKIYEAFVQGIEQELDNKILKRTVISMRRSLTDNMHEKAILDTIKVAYTETSYGREKIKNMRNYVSALVNKLEPFQVQSGEYKDPALVGSVDVSCQNSMTAAFDEMKESENNEGILKSGWQGLNVMLQGGFRRGEQWVLPALQHRYKTGFTLSLFKQFAMSNVPHMLDSTKKPMLLRISFEDGIASNLRFLYENIFFNEHGTLPDVKLIPVAEMVHVVKTTMMKTGYHVELKRVNPSLWTYKDLQNLILKYESEGFEVHCVMVDYLPMLPTTGCEEGPSGHALRDLYRRTRNFFSARKIVFITPHQLSTEAKQLIRDGRQDFVKEVAGKGYYAGSKQIDQEVDGELYLHIEKLNKEAYLTIQRGKHRGVPVIQDDEMYMVLKFPTVGPIPDDLGKPRSDLKKVGGGARGSAEENPFFAFGD
jgi:hypothetical protein